MRTAATHQGRGVLEQLALGPHAPSGFTSTLDFGSMSCSRRNARPASGAISRQALGRRRQGARSLAHSRRRQPRDLPLRCRDRRQDPRPDPAPRSRRQPDRHRPANRIPGLPVVPWHRAGARAAGAGNPGRIAGAAVLHHEPDRRRPGAVGDEPRSLWRTRRRDRARSCLRSSAASPAAIRRRCRSADAARRPPRPIAGARRWTTGSR